MHEWGPPDAPPLLCLHGITSWGGRFRRLAETRLGAFHVVALDLRGHGELRLGAAVEPRHTRRRHRRHAGLRSSSSASTSSATASADGSRSSSPRGIPERVGRIVLLDPAVWVPPHIALERAERAREDASYASVEEAIAERLDARHGNRRARSCARSCRSTCTSARTGAGAAASHRRRSSRPTARWRRRRRSTASRRRRCSSAAANREVVPEALQDVVCETMSDCRSVTVPGGHIVMWDAFDETADAILGFLDDAARLTTARAGRTRRRSSGPRPGRRSRPRTGRPEQSLPEPTTMTNPSVSESSNSSAVAGATARGSMPAAGVKQ